MTSVPSVQPSPVSADTRVAVSGDVKTMIMYDNNKKSIAVSYLLWFFFGTFGAHRFYNGKTGTAVAMLLITIFGFLLSIVYIGIFLLIPVWIWVLVDAFLIPGWARSHNNQLAHQLGVV
jgi:TM2 domain-containing membrane protein YozV